MSLSKLLLLLALPSILAAESKIPSLGYTGAPADHGGQNCSTCHNSYGAANSDRLGSLQVSVSDYIPSVSQTIRIVIQHPQASRWGFQITIREQSDETLSSGIFTVSSPDEQVACDNGTQYGLPGPCNDTMPRQFAEHSNAPTGDPSAPFEFDVNWLPPSQEVGRLHVYVAAVAANNDGKPTGDWVYTSVTTLNNAGGCDFINTPTLQTIVNGASFQPAFSSYGMVSIFGSGFQTSGRTRSAGLGDFINGGYPTMLGCLGVEVTGPGISQPVRLPIAYVSPTQINAQMPEFTNTGPVYLTVILNPDTMNAIKSSQGTFNALQAYAPAFFLLPNSTGVAASAAAVDVTTGAIVADPGVYSGAAPAKPGDIVSLYGTGFGATTPPLAVGQIATGQATINQVTVQIGGVTLAPTDVLYAGLSPGSINALYQFNVRIPQNAPSGDIPVSITIGGVSTPAATIPIQP